MACEEPFHNLLKICLSFRGSLEGSNEEKIGEATEGRGSIVKYGETTFGGDL